MLAFPGASSGKKKAGKVALSLEVALDALEKTVGRLETCLPSSTTLPMLELRAVAQARVVVEARRIERAAAGKKRRTR